MKTAALNARIPIGLKRAVDKYCSEHGLKVQSFVEDLIQQHLEDEADLKLISQREQEESLSLEQAIERLGLNKVKRS